MESPGTVFMKSKTIKKCKAIVMFGPPTVNSGLRPATYYQVTIDPSKVSPNGDYIRFGMTPGDELVGWQKVDGITVCEILGEYNEDGTYPDSDNKCEPLEMMVIEE